VARKQPTEPEPRWLTHDQEAAWRSLAALMHKLPWALDCQLQRDSDLSFIEYHALARLSEEPERRLRMSELAVLTHASLSRLSHLIKRLEARGYVHRRPDPTDGRYTIAILTAAGYEKLVAAAPAHVAAVRALVVDELTRNELAQLRQLSDRMVTRVDKSEWRQELT
jgi:DNA-binding MarR family transcriptional regulator